MLVKAGPAENKAKNCNKCVFNVFILGIDIAGYKSQCKHLPSEEGLTAAGAHVIN